MAYRLGSVDQGAANIVREVLALKPGERVTLITDRTTSDLMKPLRACAEAVAGKGCVSDYRLEAFGVRDRKEGTGLDAEAVEGAAAFSDLLEALTQSDAGVFAAVSLGNELRLRDRIRQAGVKNGGRFLHLPNLTADIMCMACCADQAAVQAYTMAVHEVADRAAWAEITSPAGTDAWVALGLRWDVAGSKLGPGQWGNVGAEIYTCPVSMDGVWVTDGGMGDIFTPYGLLRDTPLVLRVKAGCVVAAECENAELARHFVDYAASDGLGNGLRVGEFALATNPELAELGLIGVNMQDEKALTHIATGVPRPDRTMHGIVPERFHWQSHVHVDCTCRDTTVTIHFRDASPMCVLERGRPTDTVIDRMPPDMAQRMRHRLAVIREHVSRNERLPSAQRARTVQFE